MIAPLAEDTFKVQFTAGRACRDKLRQAQDLLRHRVPDGDLGTIVEKALDLLIEHVKKERFATGRRARQSSKAAGGVETRRVPRAAGEDGARQVSRAARGNGAHDPAARNEKTDAPSSRHIPDATKRAVFERDGGRCTFVDEHGRRCAETGGLEFDHLDGFARTHLHRPDRIRLLCRAHNQHAAERMYGRAFMERARAPLDAPRTRPGTSAES